MNRETIENLFTLFSGESDVDTYSSIIDVAIMQVESQIKDTSYLEDTRLTFYAAALANLSYMQILAMKIRPAQNYAGTIAENIDTDKQIKFAWGLVNSYFTLCSDILIDKTFNFLAS